MNRIVVAIVMVIWSSLCYAQNFSLDDNTSFNELYLSECGNADTSFYKLRYLGSDSAVNISISIVAPPNTNITEVIAPNSTITGSNEFSLDDMAFGETFPFASLLEAYCDAHDEIELINQIIINYQTNGTSQTDTLKSEDYRVSLYRPALQLEPKGAINIEGFEGDTLTRSYLILNTGLNSSIKTIEGFYVAENNTKLIQLKADDYPLTLTQRGDTTYFSLAQEVLGVNGIAQNDTIILTEKVYVEACTNPNNPSEITISWGCEADVCEAISIYPNIYPALGSPHITVTTQAHLNACYNELDSIDLSIVNDGSGSAIDLELRLYQTIGAYEGPHDFRFYTHLLDSSSRLIDPVGNELLLYPDSLTLMEAQERRTCYEDNSPPSELFFRFDTLHPGDSMRLRVYIFKCCFNVDDVCALSSTTSFSGSIFKYDGQYENECRNTITIIPSSLPDDLPTHNTVGTSHGYTSDYEAPTDLRDGEKGLIKYRVLSASSSVFVDDTTGYYEFEVALPSGLFPVLNDPMLGIWFQEDQADSAVPSTVTFDTTNGTLILQYPVAKHIVRLNESEILIPVQLDCAKRIAGAGNYVIMQMKANPSANCSSGCLLPRGCPLVFDINLQCPSNCTRGGFIFTDFDLKRTSFGWADNDDNGIPDTIGTELYAKDSLRFDLLELRKFLPLDTFETTATGYVAFRSETPSTFTNGYLQSLAISNNNDLTTVGNRLFIWDHSEQLAYEATNVPVNKDVLGDDVQYTYDLSLDAINGKGTVPVNYTYEEGDTFKVKANYQIINTSVTSEKDVFLTNNLFLSNEEHPVSDENRYSCGHWRARGKIIGYRILPLVSGNHTNYSCINNGLNMRFMMSVGCCGYLGTNHFPYEYRPIGIQNYIEIEPSPDYALEHATLTYSYNRGSQTSASLTISDLSPQVLPNGNLLFDIKSFFKPFGGSIWQSDEGHYGTLRIPVKPSCEVPDNLGDTSAVFGEFIPYYQFANQPRLKGESSSIFKSNKPNLSIETTSTTVARSKTKNPFWDIRIVNTDIQSAAENAWVTFDEATNAIEIDSIVNLLSGAAIQGSNGVFELGSIATQSVSPNFRIYGKYNNCEVDTFNLIAGWYCDGTSYETAQFNCPLDTVQLVVDVQSSELQVQFLENPDSLVDLCADLPFEVMIENVDPGFAYENTLTTHLPLGAGLEFKANSCFLKYSDTGSWNAVALPRHLGDNIYKWSIDSLHSTVLQQGVTGFEEAPLNRYYLRFSLTTSCSFVSGSKIKMQASGVSACGAPIASPVEFSAPIRLQSATKTESKIYVPRLTSSPVYPNRGVGIIKAAVYNFTEGVSTTSDDFCYITLPSDLNYVAGSSTFQHNAPTSAEPTISTAGGSQRLKWAITPGIADSDSMVWTFELRGENNIGNCGERPISFQTVTETTDTCVSNGTICEVAVGSQESNPFIEVIKPALDLIEIYTHSWPKSDTSEMIESYLALCSKDDTLKEPLFLQFYFDKNNDGIVQFNTDSLLSSLVVGPRIAMNDTLFLLDSFEVSAGFSCNILSTLVSDSIITACSVPTASLSASNLPNGALNETICSDSLTRIGPSPISSFTYLWTPADHLSQTDIAQPYFYYQNLSNESTKLNYLLNIDKGECITVDTVTITVGPQLFADAGRDTTLYSFNRDPVQIGGTPSALGGFLNYEYNWFPKDGTLNNDRAANPFADTEETTNYTLQVVDQNGCRAEDYMSVIHAGGVALPIQWLAVGVELIHDFPLVSWSVVESEVDYYEIEQSIDGLRFNRVGTQKSNQNGATTYTYVHRFETPISPLYYRIKQIALDGSVAYSAIVMLPIEGPQQKSFALYPNPANDEIEINTTGYGVLNTIQIFNESGQLVLGHLNHDGGDSHQKLSLRKLSPGLYFIQCRFEHGDVLEKMVIQR